ncbi:MAG: FAD:protein FMN transferase [Candidatus Dojkabacteria bacterium]
MVQKHSWSFEATGTWWTIDVWNVQEERLREIEQGIARKVQSFENTFSRFKPDSLVSRLKGQVGEFEVGEDFIDLLKLYMCFFDITAGKFTPLIGSQLEEAGYDQNYSFAGRVRHNVPDLIAVTDIVDNKTVRVYCPVSFDFGAVGKGFLIDLLSGCLVSCSLGGFCVEAGGDMFFYRNNDKSENSAPPYLKVGLEHPACHDRVIGSVFLAPNTAICGSSGNRRMWGKYHHILNPHKLRSSRLILASWVVSSYAALADAAATALFLAEPEILRGMEGVEYCVVDSNGIRTSGNNVFHVI